jgi:hypothetical protein
MGATSRSHEVRREGVTGKVCPHGKLSLDATKLAITLSRKTTSADRFAHEERMSSLYRQAGMMIVIQVWQDFDNSTRDGVSSLI